MSETNIYCDLCQSPAVVFGFQREGVKTKACENHVRDLVRKKVNTIDIEGFHFIQSTKDVAVYMERKETMERGMGAATCLRSRCEEEWSNAQTRLRANREEIMEIVRKTYEMVTTQGQKRYELVVKRTEETRNRLKRLIQERDFQLNPEDMAMCREVPTGSPFRLIIGDCRLHLVQALLSHFHFLSSDLPLPTLDTLAGKQADLGHLDIAEEVSTYAAGHGHRLSDYTEAANRLKEQTNTQLQHLLSNIETTANAIEKASECLKTGLGKVRTGEYNLAVEEMEKGRTLLKQHGLSNTELGLEICNSLAETHSQVGRYAESVSVCEEVLRSWGQHSHTCELWRSLFFLTDSFYFQKQASKAFALYEEWTGKLPTPSPLCESISLCTQANLLFVKGESEKAGRMFEDGLKKGLKLTYLAGYCGSQLGQIYEICMKKSKEAEEQYLQSCRTFSLLCPSSLSACFSLNALGSLYSSTKQPTLAEQHLHQSYLILSTRYPDTLTYGLCLYRLGLIYKASNRRQEAVQKLETAMAILRKQFAGYAKECEWNLQEIRRSRTEFR